MIRRDHWPTPDELKEAVELDEPLGWCRECGTLRDGVEPDGRGYLCPGGECGRLAVDGREVWMTRYIRGDRPVRRRAFG